MVLLLLGETNDEAAEDGTVLSLDVTEGFDQGLPLSDERAEFVTGHIHAVEGGSAGVTFNIFDLELNLSPGHVVGVVLEISQGNFDDTALDEFGGDTGTGGLGDTGLAEGFGVEGGGSFEVEPVLSGHGVNDFLLASLLAFSLTFAFSNGHAVRFIEKLYKSNPKLCLYKKIINYI